MAFNGVSNPQPIRDGIPVPKLQILLETTTPRRHIVRSGVNITPIPHRLLQQLDIMRRHPLRLRQNLRNTFRYGDLVDVQVRIRRDNRSS